MNTIYYGLLVVTEDHDKVSCHSNVRDPIVSLNTHMYNGGNKYYAKGVKSYY